MIIKTGRFGEIALNESEVFTIPQGVLGFAQYTKFCLVDPGDDTLILWLQSVENPDIAFAILEPKIFKSDYIVRLSAVEMRELQLAGLKEAAVFSILTIPEDVSQMTANLRAPVVINLKMRVGKQVILQENEFSVKHAMFKELKTHLITIQSAHNAQQMPHQNPSRGPMAVPVALERLPVSDRLRALT